MQSLFTISYPLFHIQVSFIYICISIFKKSLCMQKLLCPLVFLDTFLDLLYFTLFCAMMTTTAHSVLGTDTLWFVEGQDNVLCVSKAFTTTASILLPFNSCIQGKSRDSETRFFRAHHLIIIVWTIFPFALPYFCLHGSYFPHFSTCNFVPSYF